MRPDPHRGKDDRRKVQAKKHEWKKTTRPKAARDRKPLRGRPE